MNMNLKTLFFSVCFFAVVAFASSPNYPCGSMPFPSLDQGYSLFDVERYAGQWFEVATTKKVRSTIEAYCGESEVYYDIVSGTDLPTLNVTNACKLKNTETYVYVKGTAVAVSAHTPYRLYVDLGTPYIPNGRVLASPPSQSDQDKAMDKQYGNYIILHVWPEYQHVLVGSGDPDMSWLLSRSADPVSQCVLDEANYLLASAKYNQVLISSR